MQVPPAGTALQGRQAATRYSCSHSGSIHGIKEILAHPWFGKNAYKNFLEKKIAPPITFDSVGRIDLDKTDEKHRKELDEMLKLQRNESIKYKREMRNFYYDYTGQSD